MVHATHVANVTAQGFLTGQGTFSDLAEGELRDLRVGPLLIIVGKGDWCEDDYDAIIDRHEQAGWVVAGQGMDWWDHASGDGLDVFVMMMEEAE